MKNRFKQTMIILSLLLTISLSFYLTWGSYKVSIIDIIYTIFNQGTRFQNATILQIRIPRMLVAISVGIALSTAGALLQTITRNELADPGIIGINAGAAVAAVIFITLSTSSYYSQLKNLSVYILPIMAVLGAFITTTCVYLLAGKDKIRPKRLLLIGLGINGGLNAFIMFFMFKGGVGDFNRVLVWISGSLWGAGWNYVKIILPSVIVMFIIVMLNHKKLDVLQFTDEHVVSLGLNINNQRKKYLLYTVILAGLATAFAGNIGFIGLISPNIAKRLVGAYHKKLLIVSAMISVIITLMADAISRNMFSPIEIPVGIIISLFGVPYFMYLLVKER